MNRKLALVLPLAMAFVLLVAALPVSAANPSVTTNAATAIQDFQATLNGNLTALGSGNTKVQVGFQYGTVALLTSYTNSTVGTKTAAGKFALDVFGLSPGVKYYFRAWARNFTGDVARSQFALGSILNFVTTNSFGAATDTLGAFLPALINVLVVIFVFSLVTGVVVSLFGRLESRIGGKGGKGGL